MAQARTVTVCWTSAQYCFRSYRLAGESVCQSRLSDQLLVSDWHAKALQTVDFAVIIQQRKCVTFAKSIGPNM